MTSLRSRSLVVACLSVLAAGSSALGAAAASTPSTGSPPGRDWVWPLQPVPRVVRVFDAPADPWSSGHRGVDLLGSAGERVMAIGAGRVRFAGAVAGRGVLVINHGVLRSTYEPVTAAVHVGEQVGAGEVVGLLQTVQSHCAPEVCLHLGLRRGSVYLDPLTVLGPRPVRLKPLRSADRTSTDRIPLALPSGSDALAGSSKASDHATGRGRRTVGAAVTVAVALAVASVLAVFGRDHARG